MYKNDSLKELFHDFNHQCAYCGVEIETPHFDHFVPKSFATELANDFDNLILSCHACDRLKGDKFPLDKAGRPLLLHPLLDNWAEHIVQMDNGYLQALTPKGLATIDTLKLNRPKLVEDRILHAIDQKFDSNSNPTEHEVCMTFRNSMRNVEELNNVQLPADTNLQMCMCYMLYGNVITSLETYLCDRFLSLVNGSEVYFRKFVETFHEFQERKLKLSEFYKAGETLESEVVESIKGVLYHNLPKVSGMYRDTFDIKFPPFTEIYEMCLIRHDVVHRGGKTKEGLFHTINTDTIKQAVINCSNFVAELEKEL